MAQKLITAEIKKKMPGPRAQEQSADPICYAKFFHPTSNWTWYAYEGWQIVVNANTGEFIEERPLSAALKDGEKVEDTIFFGYVIGHDKELGTFSLNDLASIGKGRVGLSGLGIERDSHFSPTPLSVIQKNQP